MLHPLAYMESGAVLSKHVAAMPQKTQGMDKVENAAVSIVTDQETVTMLSAWAGLDLVSAIKRQLPFMEKILSLRDWLCTGTAIGSAVQGYTNFLKQMCVADALAPSLPIDLIWHTHQQCADVYGRECVALAGRFIDHDDDVPDATMSSCDVFEY
jgi:hypothetical protein